MEETERSSVDKNGGFGVLAATAFKSARGRKKRGQKEGFKAEANCF